MENFLCTAHPVRCKTTGLFESGKSVFLTNLILINSNDFEKKYIDSPSLHQGLHQKFKKSFGNYKTINLFSNNLKEDDTAVVFDELCNDRDVHKSDKEIEKYNSIEDLKCPQQYGSDQPIVNSLDDLNEKELNTPKVESELDIIIILFS